MLFRHYHPHPALRHLVNRIVISKFTFGLGASGTAIPFPPQPEHCLYFYPYQKIASRFTGAGDFKQMPQSMLVGPHVTRVDLKMEHTETLVILVGFQPGGLHRLLRIPMAALLDAPIEASLVLGNEILQVTEKLANTSNIDEMAQIIQQYLLQKSERLKHTLPLEKMLMQMLQQNDMPRVDALAGEACVSVRQLERQFKERIGLPPKVFTRLLRFSRAWLLHERHAGMSWLSIAHSCGYADQMHMIRDFKEFAGVSPGMLQQDLEQGAVRIQGNTFV